MDSQTKVPTNSLHHAGRKTKKGKRKSAGDESLKVVYISSPMKVRTSAARFRSLVQQLTGKNSDISPYLDSDEGAVVGFRDEHGMLLPDRDTSSVSNYSADTTPATSDSLLGTVDNVSTSQMEDRFGRFLWSDTFSDASQKNGVDAYPMEDQFGRFLSSDLFSDASCMDVLGSYDDLII